MDPAFSGCLTVGSRLRQRVPDPGDQTAMMPETQKQPTPKASNALNEAAGLFSFLVRTWQYGAESRDRSVEVWSVGESLGIGDEQADRYVQELLELDLLRYNSLAGDVTLTSNGVTEVVLAQSRPWQPTEHFPPLAHMSNQMMLPLSGAETVVDASFEQLPDRLIDDPDRQSEPSGESRSREPELEILLSDLEQVLSGFETIPSGVLPLLETLEAELTA